MSAERGADAPLLGVPPQPDPARTAASRRLMPGGSGNPAVDRLGALAGRLLSVASAQVSLLTDGNSLVVAGSGLPAGMLGRELSAPDSLCTLTAQFGSPLVIDDARTDPRVRDLPRVRSGTVGCFLGVPLLDAGDRVVGALGVFDPEPRRWRDDDLDLLAELGRAVATELELTALGSDLEASQTRLDLVMQAAQVGTWSLDPATGEVVWDEASARMYAVPLHDRANSMTDVADRVHPADQDGLTRAIEGALADRGCSSTSSGWSGRTARCTGCWPAAGWSTPRARAPGWSGPTWT